jgi:predicted ATPase
VLATGREALGLDREQVMPVPPLDIDGTSTSSAVELFCERAGAVLGAFEPDADEVAVIADICRRLDGLPLAIELAAVRVSSMAIGEIADQLHDRFRLLVRRRGIIARRSWPYCRTVSNWW